MNNVPQAGIEIEVLPLEVYPPHPGHTVEGQSVQHRCLVLRWSVVHVHSAQAAQTSLARPDVHRKEDGRIPTNILYGELVTDRRDTGRPQLHF